MLRIIAEKFFRILQHDRETAGSLQKPRAGYNGQDSEHDADGWCARLVVKYKSIQHKADAADNSQPNPPVPYAEEQTNKQYCKSQYHFHN